MYKFNRYYCLKYYSPEIKNGEQSTKSANCITIEYPLKLDFNISRNTFSDSNKATLTVYNLKQSTRDAIFQDYLNFNRYCFVELYAGYFNRYGDKQALNLPLILKGKVLSAYSEDNGQDVKTQIEVIDNSIIEAFSSHTFDAGTPIQDVYDTIASDLKLVELGSTGKHEGVLDRPLVVNGNALEELNELTGGSAFIDNNRLNILYNNEVLGDYGIYKINSDTGLLGMPRRRDAQIEIDVLFAPEIQVGQLVDIHSEKDPLHFDGQYKVIGLTHSGSISGADSGTVKTTLNLFAGTQLPNSNFIFTQKVDEPVTSVTGNEKNYVNIDVTKYNIHEVYNYIVKYGKPPATKITKNITWIEALNYNNLKNTGYWVRPSIEVLSSLAVTAEKLQSFVDTYYPGSKITITSGWRPTLYNKKIKGANKSQHILGKAMDFQIPGKVNSNVGKNLNKFWKWGYVQNYSSWQHCDTRGLKGVANDK